MPVQQCQTCGYIVIDPSRPCSSCGSMNPQPSTPPVQSFDQSPVYSNYGGAAEFSIGAVLSRSFSTFFKNPTVFLGLAFLALVPGLIVAALTQERATGTEHLADYILGLIIQGAIAYCVFRALKGENASIGESWKRGCEHAWTLFLVGLLEFSAIFLVAVLLFIPGAAIVGELGFLLPAVPVSILFCMWYVSYPACVAERLGVVDSLKRSAELTEGHRWKIFGLLLLMLVPIAINVAVNILLVPGFDSDKPTLAYFASVLLFITPITAFFSVEMAVTYYSLREAKEGVAVDSLANVFD